MKTILAVSDLQVPYQHKPAVKALTNFVKGWEPDEVICVGDEIDMPQISRWNKGLAGEYAGKLAKDRDETVKLLEGLNVRHVMRSNHGERLRNYLGSYAPGLADDPDLQYERYMRFADIGVTYHSKMYEFAPGWLLAHGDEGSLSSYAGQTALKLAQRTGKSVCCGHTHRAGITTWTEAHNGTLSRTLYGLEAGCLMQMSKATYLKSGGANWQLAFGLFFVDGKKVSPHVIYMRPDGSFVWEGFEWRP